MKASSCFKLALIIWKTEVSSEASEHDMIIFILEGISSDSQQLNSDTTSGSNWKVIKISYTKPISINLPPYFRETIHF